MKKTALLITAIICFSVLSMAQAPEKFSYQSVIRDADNNLIAEQEVGVQVSILQGSAEGTAVYVETQSPETNANGLMSIKIGGGDTTDDFSAIGWSDGTFYLKVEVDPDGGSNHSITAVSQILSVPFSIHAQTAEVAETFTGYEELLARIEALEEALDVIDDGTVTDIDGNVYPTVVIGNQEWMAENLRVSRYRNGVQIPSGLSIDDWSSTTAGAYAIHPHGSIDGLDSDAEVISAYGKLYNWHAVNDGRGLCPPGWSVPSHDDWMQLENYLMEEHDYHNDYENDDINGVGNALKSCRQADSPLGGDCDTSMHPRWDSHDTHHGFDEYGFSAFPGGNRHENGHFYMLGSHGHWWSSSEYSSDNAWSRYITYRYGSIFSFVGTGNQKQSGFSIRCIRDENN